MSGVTVSRGTRPSWSRDRSRGRSRLNIDRPNTSKQQRGGRGNGLVKGYRVPVHGGVQCVILISRFTTAVFSLGQDFLWATDWFHSACAWARIALCRPDTVTHGVVEVALLFQESQIFIRCDTGRKGHCLEPVHRSMVSRRQGKI